MNHFRLTTILVIILLVLAGCRSDAETPAPVQEAAPTATAAAVQPAETSTAAAPTAAAATPTETPPATPTATATAQPAATATPVVLLAAGDFGADRNPLTGEIVEDPAVLARRPLAIKISNSPPLYVRPQSGMGQADLVFEHVTEGPITRFTLIVYGQTPEKVGPIRSARLIDVELPAMYDAALVFSGSSIGVSRQLFGSDFRERILRSYEPGYYRTGEDKPWEHTLYGIPTDFWGALEANGLNTRPQFNQVMAFSERPPDGGEATSEVEIRYRDWTVVNWRYQPDEGQYLRWVDGEEHVDANDGRQLSAKNVILIFVDTSIDETICEFQQGDRCLAFSTEHHLTGEGEAIVLRDGQAYEGTWQRRERHDLLTFVDAAGEPIPLQIGNSWIQVIPTWYEDTHTLIP